MRKKIAIALIIALIGSVCTIFAYTAKVDAASAPKITSVSCELPTA